MNPLLTPEKIKHVESVLSSFIKETKPFLKIGYRLENLSEDTGIAGWLISIYLNDHIGLRFTHFINRCRIAYCMILIMEEGIFNRLNTKGIAAECGFANRNTFTAAFKKSTGCTPSQYKKLTQ